MVILFLLHKSYAYCQHQQSVLAIKDKNQQYAFLFFALLKNSSAWHITAQFFSNFNLKKVGFSNRTFEILREGPLVSDCLYTIVPLVSCAIG